MSFKLLFRHPRKCYEAKNYWLRVLGAFSLVLGLIFCGRVYGTPEENEITVIFLYDDVSDLSSIEIELKVIDAFLTYNIPCTFGLIPFVSPSEWRENGTRELAPLGQKKAAAIRSAIKRGIVEVVQHGYSHQTIPQAGPCEYTEFCGLDYDSQLRKIRIGKRHLEQMLDTEVSTFYPTWNSYDSKTLDALEALGFTIIFGMEYGAVRKDSDLKFLPLTCDLRYLRNAVKSARRVPGGQSIITVLIPGRYFIGSDTESFSLRYEEFLEHLNWIASRGDVRVSSVSEAASLIEDLSSDRFRTYNSYLGLAHYLYPLIPTAILNRLFPSGVYLTTKAARDVKLQMCLFVICFYLAILTASGVVAFYAGLATFTRRTRLGSICKYIAATLIVLASGYALHKLDFSYYKLLLSTFLFASRHAYYKTVVVLMACLGGAIGVWVSVLKVKKRLIVR